MEPTSINSILSNMNSFDNSGIKRISYMPYKISIAINVWNAIAVKLIKDYTYENHSSLYVEMIKYIHGDASYIKDINRSIGLIGPTGTGKTKTMEIMNAYSEIDSVQYYLNGKMKPFKFHIFNSRDMVDDYANNGFDGLTKYCNYSSICIDDLGSENQRALYYGTALNVIEEVIEQRYKKGLITHFTSNLLMSEILEKYKDRVYSRIIGSSNIHTINVKDFRLL